jgi:hypothetical protein
LQGERLDAERLQAVFKNIRKWLSYYNFKIAKGGSSN